jgi:transposase
MRKKHRYFSVEEKQSAVQRMAAGEAASTVARDIGAARDTLYKWYRKYQEGGADELRRTGRPRKAEALNARARSWQEAPDELTAARRQIAELQRKVGEQQVDLDFFRKALRHVEETRQAQAARGGAASTKSSKR